MRLMTICTLAVLGSEAAVSAPLAAQTAVPPIVQVPVTHGQPVLLDGQLTPGEWDDARVVPITDSLRLLVKQGGGHVFLAVATGSRIPRPVEIYLDDASDSLYVLHASAQIGERAFGDTLWEGRVPPWRWGNHVGWIANEAKEDETRPAGLPFRQRLFPADVTEFQIRRTRFSGDRWRVRIDVMVFAQGHPTDVFPPGANRDSSTWMTLLLD